MLRRVLVPGLAAVLALAVPASAGGTAPAVPATSAGSAVGYYYNGMGGTSVYFYLTGTLSFGVQTRTGSWFIGNAFGTTGASLRDNATDTQIGTCTVADTVWLDEAAPAAAEITCTGHFDGQGRDFPVALSLALPTWKDAFYYHGTGHEYHGVYAG